MNQFERFHSSQAVQVRCMRCGTGVQEVRFQDDIQERETFIVVLCHGEAEKIVLHEWAREFRAPMKLEAFKCESAAAPEQPTETSSPATTPGAEPEPSAADASQPLTSSEGEPT